MPSQNDIELIEQYLLGKLSGEGLRDFTSRMDSDQEFAREVNLMRDVFGGVKAAGRQELRNQLSKIHIESSAKPKSSKVWLKATSIAASVLFLIGLGWWGITKYTLHSNANAAILNEQAMPIAQFAIPAEYKSINGLKSNNIHFTSGEHLSVASETFKEKKIRIAFTGLSSPFDQFIAGIPTAYDSAGGLFCLKTEAQFKILINSNDNQSPTINKPLEMIVPASDTAKDYYVFKLDTVQKKWIRCGTDKLVDLSKFKTQSEVPGIVKPRLEDKTKHRFMIEARGDKFPELAEYKNYVFEIAPEEKNYNPDGGAHTWKSITIEKGKPGEPYKVTFKDDLKTVSYLANPVFAQKYFAEAMRIYNRRLNDYLASQNKELNKDEVEYINRISALVGKSHGQSLYRVITFTEPGIYSSSKLININTASKQHISFEDWEGNKLSIKQAAIADFNEHILNRINTKKSISTPLSQFRNASILAETEDHKFAYCTPDDFSNAVSTKDKTIIKLRVIEITPENYKKVKSLFEGKSLSLFYVR